MCYRNRFVILNNLFFLTGLVIFLAGCQTGIHTGPRPPLPEIDHILVEKSKRTITVFKENEQLAKYKVALGKQPVGHKERQGDHKTPEGIYTICDKNPKSKYHKALTISYPNKEDRENAATKGVSPGGEIQLHGLSKDYDWVGQHHTMLDGTRGCIVLTNREMEQIFAATKVGTKIEILP